MFKKKSKKPIIVIAVLFIGIAVAVLIGYAVLFNSIDADEKAVIDEEMGRITQDILDEIQGRSQTSELPPLQNGAANGEASAPPSEGQSSGTGQEGNSSVQKNGVIAETVAAYENGFSKLQNEGNAIVDRLVEGAKADYKSLQASGAGKLELGKLASSYTNRAKAMESSIDSSVQIVIDKMSDDLKAAGMTEADVNSYIKQIEEQYKKTKEERRKQILDEAKRYL